MFKPRGSDQPAAPAFPQVQNALYYTYFAPRLASVTRAALDQAADQQEWNSLFLSAPDFMRR